MNDRLPKGVHAAQARATEAGFPLSCEPGVGRFLAALAAGVPPGGRVLEIGTGVGVGTAWLVHGIDGRQDIELISVELDPATAAIARRGDWPRYVTLRQGNVLDLFDQLGTFDLIFADAQGGKWERLDRTIGALRPGGMVVVDDMTPPVWLDDLHRRKTAEVRAQLFSHADLVAAELAEASGMILATRRRG